MWLLFELPLLGTQPATQALALAGNPTGDPLVRRRVLNPLSHTSQGCMSNLRVLYRPQFSDGVPRLVTSVAPGSLKDMHILRPRSRPTDAQTLGLGPRQLCH